MRRKLNDIDQNNGSAVAREALECIGTLYAIEAKSAFPLAVCYALERRPALTRYRDNGRVEIDNNAAERALRAVALGRKNYLFAGSDRG